MRRQADSVLERLIRAEHLYETRLDTALEAKGLSIAKFGVLRILVESGEPQPLGQLAERLACVKSNITQLVDRLEADGLVKRLPDSSDRRSKLAAITAEGRRRYDIGLKVKLAVEQELVRTLSPLEHDRLASALEKLGGARS